MVIVGLMSGTSLDGLDIVCCNIFYQNGKYGYEFLYGETVEYNAELQFQLGNIINSNSKSIAEMHTKFGRFCAEQVNLFINKFNCVPELISSHGHTIFHRPDIHFTTQIGCGATIAAITGIDTVCDFRTKDVAMGGQGAPLVPIADKLLFYDFEGCINLGGFANISFDLSGDRVAFDICAVNTVLNYLAAMENLKFDNNGLLAASGKLNVNLLKRLNELEFYSKETPKSLGVEWLNSNVLPILDATDDSIANKLNTYCQHISICISEIINLQLKNKKILISGGGVHNKFLMQLLDEKSKAELIISSQILTDFKEAIAFAFLGFLRVSHQSNTLKSATGATRNSIGGCVYLGN